MTKEEILAMKVGLELDRLVEEVVFGHKEAKVVKVYSSVWVGNTPSPFYSTNMSAAWQLVEKMVNSGYAFCFDWASGKVATVIRCIFEENFSKAESEESEWTNGETGPEAICKAALLAKLDREKK